MYGIRGADGYISPDALTRRLRFIPDRWEKGFSKQVQAWGSRAHFMHDKAVTVAHSGVISGQAPLPIPKGCKVWHGPIDKPQEIIGG